MGKTTKNFLVIIENCILTDDKILKEGPQRKYNVKRNDFGRQIKISR